MLRFLLLILLLNITYTADLVKSAAELRIPPETRNQNENKNIAVHSLNSDNNSEASKTQSFQLNSMSSRDNQENISTNATSLNSTRNASGSGNSKINENKTESSNTNIIPSAKNPSVVDSEALLRGFYVFIGLSAITLLYVMFRSYRLRRGGIRPSVVRKYGILTQRTDMEMLPLPLDDDDEDDTVFEVGSHTHTNR